VRADDAVQDAQDATQDAQDDAQRAPGHVQSAGVAEPASGTAWLLSRQAALQARERRTERLTDGVERLRTALSPHARDIVVSQPANSSSGVMRLWLLVDDVPRLHAAVDDLRTHQRGVRIELTGPWPAYHFVRADALQDDTGTPQNDMAASQYDTAASQNDTDALQDDTAALRDDIVDSGAHR
jgi:hypothetical protein